MQRCARKSWQGKQHYHHWLRRPARGQKAIREGKIFADPVQFPDRLGTEVAEAILRHSRGEEVKPEILIPTKLYRQADAKDDPEAK